MKRMIEFMIGLLFGLGLIFAGMTDPGKVLGFLDPLGAWDPSLAFVMGGAIAVGLLPFAWAQRHSTSLTGEPMHLPVPSQIDRPLVLGSLIFGVGWGLAGFCPGPAIVAIGAGQPKALVFVVAMVLGLALARYLPRTASATAPAFDE